MPTISVIVPVYNTEKYLRRCVDSILAQSFTDFELLLIDDGSTDSSPAICDEYAKLDTRVRVFHKPNGGVSSARNLGLDYALGEWITFADADDTLNPNGLNHLISNNDKNADLVIGEFEFIFPDGKIFMKEESGDNYFMGTVIYKAVAKFHWMYWASNWNKLYKKHIIRQHGIRFIEKVSKGEDLLFNFNYLIQINSISTIKDIVYSYYGTPNSLSSKTPPYDSFKSRLVNQLSFYDKLPNIYEAQLIKNKYLYIDLQILKSMYSQNVGYSERQEILLKIKELIINNDTISYSQIKDKSTKLAFCVFRMKTLPIRFIDYLYKMYFYFINFVKDK